MGHAAIASVHDRAGVRLGGPDLDRAHQALQLRALAFGAGLVVGRQIGELFQQRFEHVECFIEAVELAQTHRRVGRCGARREDLPRAQELSERRIPRLLFEKAQCLVEVNARLLFLGVGRG